jgi:hypothetical protein
MSELEKKLWDELKAEKGWLWIKLHPAEAKKIVLNKLIEGGR